MPRSHQFLDNALRDVRHAGRALLRAPGFLIATVGTLALALGAVTGMFNVVKTVILEPLPFPAADRLVVVSGTAPGSDLPERFGAGLESYLHYREHSELIDGVFVFAGGTSTLRTDERVERVPMLWPTNDMYSTLGVRPQLGRLPTLEEDDVVVISDRLWSSWFGRDPSVIGRSYFVSDGMKRVIGVMPPDFAFPSEEALLWVAIAPDLEDVSPGQFGLSMVARMKSGVTHDALANELTRLARELPERYGGPPNYARVMQQQHQALVEPVLERIVGPTIRTSLWVLLAGVAIVLIIACVNVANLFLVRAEARRRDMAVRRAIGASRGALVRLQLAESFLVAVPAGILAVVLCTVTLPLFLRAAPEDIPRLGSIGLDAGTVVAAFVLVVITAVTCGLVPALHASSPNLVRLREGGRGSTGRSRWGRDVLVVSQTALALVLLIGAALLLQSFDRLRNVDPGYDVENIYTFQFAPDQEHLVDGPSLGAMHLDFMERLRGLPGVSNVGIVNNLPLDEGTGSARFLSDDMSEESGGALMNITNTGGDYFDVMRIDLLAGRAFTSDEAIRPNNSVIVSRTAAERFWPDRNAIGQRLRLMSPDGSIAFQVVGVVEDVKQSDWREEGSALLYAPLTGPAPDAWAMGSPAYVVKSPRADRLTAEVRALVREVAPEAPVYREFTMEFLARRSMIQLSFTMLTLGVVAGLALLLGVIGLYGVLSYVVAQRTREIGVRMAFGATTSAVQRLVVSQGARVVLVGVVVGIVAALASTRLLDALLFGISAVDPMAFVGMALVMLAVGMLASYVPARRASAVNPIESLRGE